MNCQEFHDLLRRRLDGETVVEPAGLAAHLAACGECRALQAAARRLELGLRLLRPTVPPADLSDRFVVSVLAEGRAARRRRYVVQVGLALAASVFVAVLVGLWANREIKDENVRPQPPGFARQEPRPEAQPAASSLRESLTEVAGLTLRRADETVRNLLLDAVPNDPKASPLSSSVATLREAGNGVTAGLEPVTDSARRAFDRFLREIPAVRTQEKRGS